MDNVIVISQNLRLDSLDRLRSCIRLGSLTLIVSTQLIFKNEAKQIDSILGCRCIYVDFSALISDAEAEKCDQHAFEINDRHDLQGYFDRIKKLKNKLVIGKIIEKYPAANKFILCDDLGLDLQSWIDAGFSKVECEYYYVPESSSGQAVLEDKISGFRNFIRSAEIFSSFIAWILRWRRSFKRVCHAIRDNQMYIAKEAGNIYYFLGNMNRIAYRLRLKFRKAGKVEQLFYFLKTKGWFARSRIFCLSTLHEGYQRIPDRPDMNVKLMQDGYLPPNYSSRYLMFYGVNTEFWTWDVEGLRTFYYHNLPCRVIPIRKKLYLPEPIFPIRLRKVLCAASGDGDWTAVKNRSDEDKLVTVFAQLAAHFPDVEFVFRCHPVWTYPVHQGVNSIKRVVEYFDYLHLPNLKVSSNRPIEKSGCLSFMRSSFESDLEDVDLVLGEHSIAMVDAGFKKKIFCSVNVTGHRDFYLGMTEMGFPHCESLSDLVQLLKEIATDKFKERYMMAVRKYNDMTDQN